MSALFPVPNLCPVCSGPLVETGDFLYCQSKTCPARLSSAVKVWVSRLGLLHWGDAMIEALSNPDSPAVTSVAGLYFLTEEELTRFCSGRKMAAKCHQTLHAARSMSAELFLSALNIPSLGIATATDIVSAGFDNIQKILTITYDDLLKVPNIGDITARQIMEGLTERRDVVISLSTVLEIKSRSPGPLSGLSFCITGATSKPRKAVQKDISDAGGMVRESVVQGLTHLVTNHADFTSKFKKAVNLGVHIISEAELYRMIKGHQA